METIASPIAGFLLLLGLGFFFGLAFEEFHGQGGQARPGGVRSFPLLTLSGALLYRLDRDHLLPLTAGLLVLGMWLACYYWRHAGETDPEGRPNVGLMVPICNLLAYLLGPIVLAEPSWMGIGVTVAAVLLLTERERLHGFARRLELSEIITAGKFLILTGLVLPFLPDKPIAGFSEVTPHQVWLAVIAVSTLSYPSYLLQRFVAPAGIGLWVALLGGLYSSTVTTVVLARRVRTEAALLRQAQTEIVLATAVMYVRLLVIVGVFDLQLALRLASPLLILAAIVAALAGAWYWGASGRGHATCSDVGNSGQPAGAFRCPHLRRPLRRDLVDFRVGARPFRRSRSARIGWDRRRRRHRSFRAEHRRGRTKFPAGQQRGRGYLDRRLIQQPHEGGLRLGVCRRARRSSPRRSARSVGSRRWRGGVVDRHSRQRLSRFLPVFFQSTCRLLSVDVQAIA